MSDLLERLHVLDCTVRGREILCGNADLQQILELYTAADETEKARVPGVICIGAGRYSYVFRAPGGVALKISSPTSSRDAFKLKRKLTPENLAEQFTVLETLREYLDERCDDIVAPEQYFVTLTPSGAYLLGQQYMEDWISLEDATYGTFGDPTDPHTQQEVADIAAGIRERLLKALADFPLRCQIDDLCFHRSRGVHGTNVLVPSDRDLTSDVPLCIIDQPGHPKRASKRMVNHY